MQSRCRPDTYSRYVWYDMIDMDSEIEHYKELGLDKFLRKYESCDWFISHTHTHLVVTTN